MHINLENITYQEEIETENSPKITKEIWRIVMTSYKEKSRSRGFISEFYQTFKGKNNSNLSETFQSVKKEQFLPALWS